MRLNPLRRGRGVLVSSLFGPKRDPPHRLGVKWRINVKLNAKTGSTRKLTLNWSCKQSANTIVAKRHFAFRLDTLHNSGSRALALVLVKHYFPLSSTCLVTVRFDRFRENPKSTEGTSHHHHYTRKTRVLIVRATKFRWHRAAECSGRSKLGKKSH